MTLPSSPRPTGPPPAGPPHSPPPVGPPPAPVGRRQASHRSVSVTVVIGVVLLFLLAGAFVVGRITGDPTTTDKYKAQTKGLRSTESELTDANRQLDAASDEVEALEGDVESLRGEVSDAEAQVDALLADIPAGESPNEPALSDGVAIAPRNLVIHLRTRSKECFGSAGCNVTVQADPNYVGNQDVSSGSWEITYEIRGGEDGPIIETMTLTDGTFTFPEEQFVSTLSTSTTLQAVVTEVYALD